MPSQPLIKIDIFWALFYSIHNFSQNMEEPSQPLIKIDIFWALFYSIHNFSQNMEESKMNWKRLVVMVVVNIFLCLAFLPDYGAAGELKKVYTLREAVSEALANNPDFRAKMEEIEQAVQGRNPGQEPSKNGIFPKTEYGIQLHIFGKY
jgi:hypothetical protein